jgi:hypothetical protein
LRNPNFEHGSSKSEQRKIAKWFFLTPPSGITSRYFDGGGCCGGQSLSIFEKSVRWSSSQELSLAQTDPSGEEEEEEEEEEGLLLVALSPATRPFSNTWDSQGTSILFDDYLVMPATVSSWGKSENLSKNHSKVCVCGGQSKIGKVTFHAIQSPSFSNR